MGAVLFLFAALVAILAGFRYVALGLVAALSDSTSRSLASGGGYVDLSVEVVAVPYRPVYCVWRSLEDEDVRRGTYACSIAYEDAWTKVYGESSSQALRRARKAVRRRSKALEQARSFDAWEPIEEAEDVEEVDS